MHCKIRKYIDKLSQATHGINTRLQTFPQAANDETRVIEKTGLVPRAALAEERHEVLLSIKPGNTLMKLHRIITAAVLSLTLTVPGLAFADTVNLKANLLASSEVTPKDSQGHGTLDGTYDTATKLLQWKVTYADLTGPPSMAHFHGPAPIGKNAGVVVPIDPSKLSSPIDGSAPLTDIQAKDLLAGNWYFNVHTAKNPSGEIRGQVEPVK